MGHPVSIAPRGTAAQPPTAPMGGGFTPTRGRGLRLPQTVARMEFL